MSEIYALVVWHYHAEGRVYHDLVVQVADDPDLIENVKTVFNNDFDNSAVWAWARIWSSSRTSAASCWTLATRKASRSRPLRTIVLARQHVERFEPLHRSRGVR